MSFARNGSVHCRVLAAPEPPRLRKRTPVSSSNVPGGDEVRRARDGGAARERLVASVGRLDRARDRTRAQSGRDEHEGGRGASRASHTFGGPLRRSQHPQRDRPLLTRAGAVRIVNRVGSRSSVSSSHSMGVETTAPSRARIVYGATTVVAPRRSGRSRRRACRRACPSSARPSRSSAALSPPRARSARRSPSPASCVGPGAIGTRTWTPRLPLVLTKLTSLRASSRARTARATSTRCVPGPVARVEIEDHVVGLGERAIDGRAARRLRRRVAAPAVDRERREVGEPLQRLDVVAHDAFLVVVAGTGVDQAHEVGRLFRRVLLVPLLPLDPVRRSAAGSAGGPRGAGA